MSKKLNAKGKQSLMSVFALLHLKSCCIPRDSRMFDPLPPSLAPRRLIGIYVLRKSTGVNGLFEMFTHVWCFLIM